MVLVHLHVCEFRIVVFLGSYRMNSRDDCVSYPRLWLRSRFFIPAPTYWFPSGIKLQH